MAKQRGRDSFSEIAARKPDDLKLGIGDRAVRRLGYIFRAVRWVNLFGPLESNWKY